MKLPEKTMDGKENAIDRAVFIATLKEIAKRHNIIFLETEDMIKIPK